MAALLSFLINLYMLCIIIRVIASWLNPNPYHPVIRQVLEFIYDITEPVLAEIRRFLPVFGGLDLSPLVLLLVLQLLLKLLN